MTLVEVNSEEAFVQKFHFFISDLENPRLSLRWLFLFFPFF